MAWDALSSRMAKAEGKPAAGPMHVFATAPVFSLFLSVHEVRHVSWRVITGLEASEYHKVFTGYGDFHVYEPSVLEAVNRWWEGAALAWPPRWTALKALLYFGHRGEMGGEAAVRCLVAAVRDEKPSAIRGLLRELFSEDAADRDEERRGERQLATSPWTALLWRFVDELRQSGVAGADSVARSVVREEARARVLRVATGVAILIAGAAAAAALWLRTGLPTGTPLWLSRGGALAAAAIGLLGAFRAAAAVKVIARCMRWSAVGRVRDTRSAGA